MSKNGFMSTETPTTNAKAELEAAIEHLINGTRDPEMMRRARERMDQMREDLRQRIGIVEVAVDLIREACNP